MMTDVTSGPRKGSSLFFRIFAGGVIALLLLAGVLPFLAPRLIDQETYKKRIIETVAKTTGYRIGWKGEATFSLFPSPHAGIREVTLKAGTVQVLSLEEVNISLALLPLFSKRVEVRALELVGLDVALVTGADGTKTWVTEKIEKNVGVSGDEADPSGQSKGQTETGTDGVDVVLDKVKIVGGRLVYRDARSETSYELKNVNATLQAESLKGPFTLSGDMLVEGQQTEVSLAAGKMAGNESSYPLQVKAALPGLGVEAEYSGVVSTVAPFRAEGEVTLSAQKPEEALAAFGGKGGAESLALPEEIKGPFSLHAGILYGGDKISLSSLKLSLGDVSLSGEAAFSPGGGFDFDLAADKSEQAPLPESLLALLSGLSLKAKGMIEGDRVVLDQSALRIAEQNVALSGVYDLSRKSFDLAIKAATDNAESLLARVAPQVQIPVTLGKAAFDGKAKGTPENLSLSGTLDTLGFSVTFAGDGRLPLASFASSPLGIRIMHPDFGMAVRNFVPDFRSPFAGKGKLDLKLKLEQPGDGQFRFRDIEANLGGIPMSGELDLATGSAVPALSGQLAFGDIVFPAPSSPSSSSSGGEKTDGGGKPSASVSSSAALSRGRWSSSPIQAGWMKAFNADVSVTAKSLTQNLWKLTNARLAFILKGGVLSIKDLGATMFGGKVTLNGEIDSSASPLAFGAHATARGVDARSLHSALTSRNSDTISGLVSEFNLDVESKGNSPADLVSALGGKGQLMGQDLVIKGVDAAQLAMTAKGSYKPLERAGTLFSSFQGGQTEFTDLACVFDVEKGIVTFSKLGLDGPKATIESKGIVDLPAWTIDLKNTMTVKGTDIPPFDFRIHGPLDRSVQAGGQVIEDYLRARMEKKVNKLLEKELGKLLGGAVPSSPSPSPATAPPSASAPAPAPSKKQKQAEDAVKILEGLLGH